ncbi:sulfotransferase family protein [Paraglaciecola marina]|uniref:sulfotransferase family protein n=1 Tax=Paraglaciecola marina TaxID=2500157 RepID=UPI0010600F19|nr:sulfotransferase [Paraglaciecola marina]
MKKNSPIEKPHFICIGSQRAGTTWLHECLSEHPDVFVPEQKELHFFNTHYEKGLEYYQSHFLEADENNKNLVVGEVTPNYYHDKTALLRIKEHYPNVKIIFILREPVSRAFSHYQLSSMGPFQGLSFKDAYQQFNVIKYLSNQSQHLQNVFEIFGNKHVLVKFYDDISKQPENFVSSVYKFIDVNVDFVPEKINQRINRIVLPDLQDKLNRLGLSFIIELVKKSPFSELIKKKFQGNSKTNNKNDLAEYKKDFTQDIEKLESLLGVNLEHWK